MVLPLIIIIQTTLPIFYSFTNAHNKVSSTQGRHLSEMSSTVRQTNNSSTQSRQEELLLVIADKKLRELFLHFLESEFSVENLLFIEACTAFENASGSSHTAAKELAISIRGNFLELNSPSCVNLSSSVRADLDLKFTILSTNCDARLFQEAKEEVLKMLAVDSFSRFRQTKDFQIISEPCRSQELLRAKKN
eukprot:TRINITY_DN6297_c0_g2_i1.p1 TRINITY_DN6297_c0_g2~~TRINITY_DN6297_c0_g2_i1.p1  ORF type:complete len:192 (+),score=45.56 TRINITY_DN6297_c0_g2_i1:3-578(+)